MVAVDEIDWSATGGRLIEFEDGHVPENLSSTTTRLVAYDDYLLREPSVEVHDDMDQDLVDALYQATVQQGQPWGTYVRMSQVKEYWNHPETVLTESLDDLALRASAVFLEQALQGPFTRQYGGSERMWTHNDLDCAHGIAVWALCAAAGSQVPYHIDYAEGIRYQSNIMVPPVLAGTLQCTSTPVQGGDFVVYMQGLDHYRKHGYKGTLQPIADDGKSGLVIDYRYRRLIVASGHLPHASTKIIHTTHPRVIVGFNVFLPDIGPLVELAPEHSEAFCQQVRRQRQQVSLATVQSSPVLGKLLVQARRLRAKQEFAQKQQGLDADIRAELERHGPLSIQALMERLGQASSWPTGDDILVHIDHRRQQGRWHLEPAAASPTSIVQTGD